MVDMVFGPSVSHLVSQGYGIEITLYLGLVLGGDEMRTCGWPDGWAFHALLSICYSFTTNGV